MRRIAVHLLTLAALLCGALSLGAQGTRADSLDAQCIDAKAEALKTANGTGNRRNLADQLKACNASWFARAGTRVDTIVRLRVDTLVDTLAVHDTTIVVKTDTVFVSQPPVDTTPPPDTQPPVPQPSCQDEPLPDSTRGVAELPRVYLRGCYPKPARSYLIPASQSLQTALDTAKAGDEIRLNQGTVYSGNLVWSRCVAVSLTTNAAVAPEGVRVDSTVARPFARLVSPNISPALLAKAGSCGLTVSRVQISATPQSATVNYNYALVRIGEGESVVELQPADIVLDRVYVHGSDSTYTQNAVVFNGRRLTLRDSWVDHVRWKGVESHCVSGYAGQGPIRLTNNHFDCAGIGVLFGGARRAIAGVAPSDIEVRRNHFVKDSAFSTGYVAKNLFEVKDARRVLFEGNVLAGSWVEAQDGMAINLQSLTDEADTTVQTLDVTVRYNRVSDAAECFAVSARGYNNVAAPMTRVEISHNLCQRIGRSGMNRGFLLTADLHDLRVDHNTVIRNDLPATKQATITDGGPAVNVTFTNNVVGNGQLYGCTFRSGGATGFDAWAAFSTTVTVAGNVCWNNAGKKTPAGDFFPADQASVGFAPDWSLTAASPYKNKGTDGKDPGVDVAELTKRTAGVVQP